MLHLINLNTVTSNTTSICKDIGILAVEVGTIVIHDMPEIPPTSW